MYSRPNRHHNTLHRLGTSYINYRLFLALGLITIALIAYKNDLFINDIYTWINLTLAASYLFFCIVNFFTFNFYSYALQKQVFIYLILDLIHLTISLFLTSTGPNIVMILLYMMIVLAATMTLNARNALIITLASIIAVVYQQFFFSVLNLENISSIGTSGLVTLVFLSTHLLGQVAIRRLEYMESLALEQKQSILELQQINHNIVEQLDLGFIVIDDDARIITINDAAKQFLGFNRFWVGTSTRLDHLLPTLWENLQSHTDTTFRGTFDLEINEDLGKVSIQYRPIHTQRQQLTLLIIDSLQHINQHAQQLKLASLGQLSASIAHEIRNPLAAISQANELLQEDVNPEDAILHEMIKKQTQRINRIIEDTLNMSRQHRTVQDYIQLSIWLRHFIYDDLADIKAFLRLRIEDDLCLFFDSHQLRLILINIIRNAIRHGHEVDPTNHVYICAYTYHEFIIIDVIDEGLGVPKTQQKNLFTPFYTTATHGTGLGLYLSKTFCEANHASLRYIAQEKGACFRIECKKI